ncbi:MAG: hypothetical protein QNJ58_22170, partial [Desulfobacterales bacterium]|nr:hypothetical protein [Desulfobacterales bacterium]
FRTAIIPAGQPGPESTEVRDFFRLRIPFWVNERDYHNGTHLSAGASDLSVKHQHQAPNSRQSPKKS